jgi:hypothetical protein
LENNEETTSKVAIVDGTTLALAIHVKIWKNKSAVECNSIETLNYH